jgi:hypothetical protein
MDPKFHPVDEIRGHALAITESNQWQSAPVGTSSVRGRIIALAGDPEVPTVFLYDCLRNHLQKIKVPQQLLPRDASPLRDFSIWYMPAQAG